MGRKVSSRRRRTKVLFLSFPFVYRSSRDFQVVSFPCIVLSTQLNYCFDIIILRKNLPTIAFLRRLGHEGDCLREYQSNSWLGSNMVHASTLSRSEPRVRVAMVIGHQTIFFYLVSNATKNAYSRALWHSQTASRLRWLWQGQQNSRNIIFLMVRSISALPLFPLPQVPL